MAATITYVIFLTLLLRVSFSMPVLFDLKTVQPKSDTAISAEKTVMDVTETILGLENETKLVQNLKTEAVLNAVESVDVHKRIRRDITRSKELCPADMIAYGNRCLTPEQIADYNDVSDGSSDEYVEES